jgi:hypothetical protein
MPDGIPAKLTVHMIYNQEKYCEGKTLLAPLGVEMGTGDM